MKMGCWYQYDVSDTFSADSLVLGDIVLLKSGDKVPADLRLIEVKNLQIQEAILTGESLPVEKSIDAVDSHAELRNRTYMAYSGTLVSYGKGVGVVVATGMRTEVGSIGTLLTQIPNIMDLYRFIWPMRILVSRNRKILLRIITHNKKG